MSTNPAQKTTAAQTARVHSFLEDSCHDHNDQLKQFLTPVVFRLFSVGQSLGPRVDAVFVADYGIYYDNDDNPLIRVISDAVPHVNWADNKIFHRVHDKPRIDVLNAETGRVIARIETRRYFGRAVKTEAVEAGAYGENVVPLKKPELSAEAPD